MYPWKSAAVICTIVIGAACLVIFGFWEAFSNTKYPLMPMKFFRNRGFISLVACATGIYLPISSASSVADFL